MKKKIVFLFLFFFLGLLCFSGYKIITYLLGNRENKRIQESLQKNIVKIESSENKQISYQIDFLSLEKENPDTVGYLEVRGTNINYVVVQGKDNSYYLNHNYNKSYNMSGWIYVDYRNLLDESDKNIIIYGHSIRDGSMFGSLKNVFQEEWQKMKENQVIDFVTKMGTYHYQVFSIYEIEVEDYYLQTSFDDEEEYLSFIENLKNRSSASFEVELLGNDKILTLSTCNWNGHKRVVLHAKLIDLEEDKNE